MWKGFFIYSLSYYDTQGNFVSSKPAVPPAPDVAVRQVSENPEKPKDEEPLANMVVGDASVQPPPVSFFPTLTIDGSDVVRFTPSCRLLRIFARPAARSTRMVSALMADSPTLCT